MLRYAPLLALAASQPGLAMASSNGSDGNPPAGTLQTVVFASDQCLITSDKAAADGAGIFQAILGFLFPLAVEFAFDQVSAELKKVKKKTSSGSVEFELWTRKKPKYDDKDPNKNSDSAGLAELEYQFPRCVTVVTGTFAGKAEGKRTNSVNRATQVPNSPGAKNKDLLKRLSDNGISPSKIHYLFEAEVKPSADRTSYGYDPKFVAVYELLPGNGSSRTQGAVLEVSLEGPGAKPWGTAYSSAAFSLGQTSAPLILDSRDSGMESKKLKKLNGLRVSGLTFPGISEDAMAAFKRDRGEIDALDTGWLIKGSAENPTCAKAREAIPEEAGVHPTKLLDCNGQEYRDYGTASFMPARLKAEWTQTKKPSDAAKAFAAILDKAKPKASSFIASQFDSDAKFKSQQDVLGLEITFREAENAFNTLPATATDAQREIARLKMEKARAAWERAQ